MKDPHVVSLTYTIVDNDVLTFKDPPDFEIETAEFHGLLSNGILTLEPKNHYSSVAQIRPLADDYVRGWEIDRALRSGSLEFNFRFEGAQIVDRQPGPGKAFVDILDVMTLVDSVDVKKSSTAYPAPPDNFQITTEVEVLWKHYSRFLKGGELLQSMAYSCLDLLEGRFAERGKRRRAANHYGIDFDVLKNLGELTSNRGDPVTARKPSKARIPLSASESRWVKEAIKAIIKHLATRQPGQILKMSDLPPLT
jgi:hypothetical protein